MRLYEILEAKIKNTGHIFDKFKGISAEAREIRQIYNLCINKNLSIEKRRQIMFWATYIINDTLLQQNSELIDMLDEIIRISAEK